MSFICVLIWSTISVFVVIDHLMLHFPKDDQRMKFSHHPMGLTMFVLNERHRDEASVHKLCILILLE